MLRNYLSITWKVLMRRKFFTFVSLFGTSFTLLVLTMAAAFIDHSFNNRAPESKFDKVIYTGMSRLSGQDNNWNSNMSYQTIHKYFLPLADQMPDVIEKISIYDNGATNHTFRNGKKIAYRTRHADGHYFEILDFNFLEGTPYTQEDEVNGNLLAVINQALKTQYFGEEAALGQDFIHEGRRFKVIGVVENVPELRKLAFADMWVPISSSKAASLRREIEKNNDLLGQYCFAVLAKDQAFLPAIKQAIREASGTVEIPDTKFFDKFQTTARTHFEHFAADVRLVRDWENYFKKEFTGPLIALFIAGVLVFMLLPSLNLVNLNLSRMMERASEVGVRRAFGAPIGSLMQQFIIENILLSIAGGLLGFLLSVFALHALNNSGIFTYANFSVNFKVFAIGFFLSVVFGLLSGVYPAWRMARLNPVAALKGTKA